MTSSAKSLSSIASSTAVSALESKPLVFFFVVATLADSADATCFWSSLCASTSTWLSSAACVAAAVSSCFSAAFAFFSAISAPARLPSDMSCAARARARLAFSPSCCTCTSTFAAALCSRSLALCPAAPLAWPKMAVSIRECVRADPAAPLAEAASSCASRCMLAAPRPRQGITQPTSRGKQPTGASGHSSSSTRWLAIARSIRASSSASCFWRERRASARERSSITACMAARARRADPRRGGPAARA